MVDIEQIILGSETSLAAENVSLIAALNIQGVI